MELRQWNELPDRMRTREVRKYYNIIAQRRGWFCAKRVFDVIVSLIMLVFLAINDIDLKYTDTELIELILSVASGTQSDSDILQWLQQHII